MNETFQKARSILKVFGLYVKISSVSIPSSKKYGDPLNVHNQR